MPRHNLPLLKRRPNINLISKAALTLRMQIPISLRNIVRIDLSLSSDVDSVVISAWNIDRPVNNSVGNMDALGSELLRERCG
jgi:hypothetical protein